MANVVRFSSAAEDMRNHPDFYEDGITEQLANLGKPVTRDNYIGMAFAGDPRGLPPEPWEAEDENRLPAYLQTQHAAPMTAQEQQDAYRESVLENIRRTRYPAHSDEEWEKEKPGLIEHLSLLL